MCISNKTHYINEHHATNVQGLNHAWGGGGGGVGGRGRRRMETACMEDGEMNKEKKGFVESTKPGRLKICCFGCEDVPCKDLQFLEIRFDRLMSETSDRALEVSALSKLVNVL